MTENWHDVYFFIFTLVSSMLNRCRRNINNFPMFCNLKGRWYRVVNYVNNASLIEHFDRNPNCLDFSFWTTLYFLVFDESLNDLTHIYLSCGIPLVLHYVVFLNSTFLTIFNLTIEHVVQVHIHPTELEKSCLQLVVPDCTSRRICEWIN